MDFIEEKYFYSIGIDFGQSNIYIGVFRHQKVEIIPNYNFRQQTPSYISFTDDRILFGEEAKIESIKNPSNTIYDIKRIIGRKFSDPEFQKEMQNWPFKIVSDYSDSPIIEVEFKGQMEHFTPCEILTMMFKHIKKTAENHLTPKNKYKKVKYTVLSVPTYFDENQRNIMKMAAQSAGLNVMTIPLEPIMSCISFGISDHYFEEIRKSLVLDLGGKTFDISLFDIDGGLYELIKSKSYINLGGDDIDDTLMNYFSEGFKEKFNCDLRKSSTAVKQLKFQCERLKIALSSRENISISCKSIFENHDLIEEISRSKFESLNDHIFKSIVNRIDTFLKEVKVEKNELNYIVLTGGPSNIPQIKNYIHDFFDGKEIITSKNPEQTVVSGVSIHAEIWKSDINCRNRCDVFVVNEINKTTGIRTSNQIKLDFIKSGHYIWENIEKGLFTTSHDSQKKVIIQVYEGERVKINDSHLIGTFEFKINKPFSILGLLNLK